MRTQNYKSCHRIIEEMIMCRAIIEYCKAESEDEWTHLSDIIINNITECSEMLDKEAVVRVMSLFEVSFDKLS